MAKRTQSTSTRARRSKADEATALPNIPEPGDLADRAQEIEMPHYESITPDAITSESMASEPSEEDIRLRAYHRYLERGGGHGAHFDDWVAAQDELKNQHKKTK